MLGNKVISKRENEKKQEKHEFRLRNMKSMTDSSPPMSLVKKIPNAKKIQLLEEKCTEIERENRILYEKMLRIQNKTPTLRSDSTKKSLNHNFRKKRLMEIEKANSQLLERLKKKDSAYKLEKFNDERKATEKILNTISQFPLIYNKSARTTTTSFYKKTPKKLDPIPDSLVYRQGKILNKKSYLLEIYKSLETYKIIAFDLESSEKFIVTLLSSEVENIMENQQDYRKLTNLIDLRDKELIIKYNRPLSSIN